MSRKDKDERRGTPDGGEPRVEVPRSPLSLAMAVEQVRAELIEAQRQGEGQDLRFNVDAVELTLGIEFGSEDSSEKSVDGGVQVGVIRAGGHGGAGNRRSRRATNTVTLRLTPQRPADGNGHKAPVTLQGALDEVPQ